VAEAPCNNAEVTTHPTQAWRVEPLTADHAHELVTWSYPPPLERYSLAEGDPGYFTDPENRFVALLDSDDQLVGFRSFGPDGRVPGGRYDESALDTGGGLRPDLVGRGLGLHALQVGLAYGAQTFAPDAFRTTVWSGNGRALTVTRNFGYVDQSTFTSTTGGDEYIILVRRGLDGLI
jgi:[ribosomal protein S18]-alanine N-acetyltransferase